MDLKANESGRFYPQKRLRDGEGEVNAETVSCHDGDDKDNRDGNQSDDDDEPGRSNGSDSCFKLSEEGEAFLEAACDSHMEYKTRVAQATRYGKPDSKWTTCPELSAVVAATLPKGAVKEDKVAFRTQQMYMEAIAPLAALLEDAIPMVQSAIMLLGDAAQHHTSLRRKAILQYLNPQLQALMKDADFKQSQPFLFGEDFGDKAKARLEAAAALKKAVNPPVNKGKQMGFQGGHPQRNNWGRQGATWLGD